MNGYNIVYVCPRCNRKKDNYYITYFHKHYYQEKGKEFYNLSDVLYCIRMCMRYDSNYRDYYLQLSNYHPDDLIGKEIVKIDNENKINTLSCMIRQEDVPEKFVLDFGKIEYAVDFKEQKIIIEKYNGNAKKQLINRYSISDINDDTISSMLEIITPKTMLAYYELDEENKTYHGDRDGWSLKCCMHTKNYTFFDSYSQIYDENPAEKILDFLTERYKNAFKLFQLC